MKPLQQQETSVQEEYKERITQFDKFTEKKSHDPKTTFRLFSPVKHIMWCDDISVFDHANGMWSQTNKCTRTVE
jgi:hypothetical protein